MENYDGNKIEMVKKLDVYKERALNGSLSQSELMELCDLIYGKDSKESSVVYERINELIKRNEKEFFTKKFMIVDSGNIGVTDEKKSIIGVQGLGPCIGLILYNKECKKAFVAHIRPEQIFNESLSNFNDALDNLETEIYGILTEQEMLNREFDLILVEGAYKNLKEIYSYQLGVLKDSNQDKYNPLQVLEIKLRKIEFMNINSVRVIKTDDDTPDVQISNEFDLSREFAFDSDSGQFVTDKVYFGKEYLNFTSNYVK